jgi:hypothetical protein
LAKRPPAEGAGGVFYPNLYLHLPSLGVVRRALHLIFMDRIEIPLKQNAFYSTERTGKEPMDKNQLCRKIKEIYPRIGECGVDVEVEFDQSKGAWAVDLKKDNQELKTYLEPTDAQACLRGEECVSLGLQVGQLLDNIEKISPILERT